MSSIVAPALAATPMAGQVIRLLLATMARAAARAEVRRGQRRLADAAVVMGV